MFELTHFAMLLETLDCDDAQLLVMLYFVVFRTEPAFHDSVPETEVSAAEEADLWRGIGPLLRHIILIGDGGWCLNSFAGLLVSVRRLPVWCLG